VDTSFAESAFDVVERPIALPADTAAWVEQPVPTHPQLAFAGLSDGQSGLMIANRGLPEYEALSEAGGATIALTLLRCVGWLSRDDLGCRRGPAGPQLETPEAQCPGTYSFDYAMIPHHGDWRHAYQQAHAFSVPLRAVTTDQHEGSLPLELSFVEPGPRDLVVSAVKAPEEGQGLIVRFHNMADHEVNAQVGLCTPFRKATLADLNEQDLGQLVIPPHGKVLLPVRGKEMVTVRFEV
jgi:mannosylglycerate hydrolase